VSKGLFLLLLALAVAPGGSAPAIPASENRVDASHYDAFWLWAGV
jgi:hypothetical protein